VGSISMTSYPIDGILPELKRAVLNNHSVVLHAPPGAGKTTRVPLALLDVFTPEQGRILLLEPRRIAAVSAARWMAQTLGRRLGETVGYSIRFESHVSALTRVEVVTEGVLVRRIQADPELSGVAMVVFDEFHERSLNADLALALCLDIRLSLRADLKVLVMSATLECGPVSSLLGGVPVITSSGKAFPVEERYIADRPDKSLTERIVGAVRTALHEVQGDILVFLPGTGEIRACDRALKSALERRHEDITIHSLYGDLPLAEQERAILPSLKRKVVLATNVAETSLTIEGVRVVIDSGLTRRLQYDPATGMNRLVTMSVSKASAEQRKGRAGRLGPGICYRLYSRYDFQTLVPFTPPEIIVSDLSALVLELAVWGVKDPAVLSWLDAPPAAAWDTSVRLLRNLGALDSSGSATSEGKLMSRLPLHPRLAKMMVRAGEHGHSHTGADLAALLTERDIAGRSGTEPDVSERLDILHEWREKKEVRDKVDLWALRAVDMTSRHLVRLMREIEKGTARTPVDTEEVSRLLLCAFPDRIAANRGEGGGRFVLAHGRGVRLSPVSRMGRTPFIIAIKVDAGVQGDGVVHLAAAVSETLIRREYAECMETLRRVEWDKRDNRILAVMEERMGGVLLSSKPFSPDDEEAARFLCEAVRLDPGMLSFGKEARQLQGRVSLMRKVFPEETWPELAQEFLLSTAEEWLSPWLSGMRSREDIVRLDILPALKAMLSQRQSRLLEERLPAAISVPSGSRITLDYASGDTPVLAVKLQEMFGLADTPLVADGRVKVLIHLLSPAGRPVQITQDLRGFWNSGYKEVKKELMGRYPKHPWPADPWNAIPTKRTKKQNHRDTETQRKTKF
jgi:ATP-dependent helicase HrpB